MPHPQHLTKTPASKPQTNKIKSEVKTYLTKEEKSQPRKGVSHTNKPTEPKRITKTREHRPFHSQANKPTA